MTPRERVQAVLKRQIADRIPKFEIWIDALHADLGCDDPAGIYVHLGQDCVMLPSCQPEGSNTWKSGIDEFGRIWRDGVYAGGVVDSPAALDQYSPPLEDTKRYLNASHTHEIANKYPDHCLIWGTHIGPFTAAYMAMGFSRFFTTLIDSPDFIMQVMDARTEWCIEMYRYAQQCGAEILVLGDDAGTVNGPMISPDLWRKLVFPYHKRIVDALDVPIIWHSDGDVTSLLPQAIEAGFVGYHGVDIIAGVSLEQVKEVYGHDLVLIGNVDIRVLFQNNLGDVRREVLRCVNEGASGGGYMFASCNSICEGMNPHAVAEMYHHIALFDRY